MSNTNNDENDKPYAVVSGTGAGWGRYATKEEAEERADYIRINEPDVIVAKKIGP